MRLELELSNLNQMGIVVEGIFLSRMDNFAMLQMRIPGVIPIFHTRIMWM